MIEEKDFPGHCRGAFSREEATDIHEGFVSYYARRA